MDKKQMIIVASTAAVLLALIAGVLAVVLMQKEPIYGDFVPPAFEQGAVEGMPATPPPNYGKMSVAEGFEFYMCATPAIKENQLQLSFTSPATNTVWMRVRVYDSAQRLLGESGLLCPNEHLPALFLTSLPTADDTTVHVTVLSYEPQTYYSKGSATATLTLATGNELSKQ